MDTYNDKIMKIFNMEYVMHSPENANVCVDMLFYLVKEHALKYKDIAMKIAEDLASTKINIMSARGPMSEIYAGHVINAIYAILQEIVKEEPYELGKAKRISDILEQNNRDFIKEIQAPISSSYNQLINRNAFFNTVQMHTNAEKVKKMHQERN